MTFTESTITTSFGPLVYTETGSPGAPAVVLLHGWPQNWSAWRRVMELGFSSARLIALDLPGVGRSVDCRTDGSTLQIAAAVRELVLALGLQDVTLVGHDMGGMVTYSYLRKYDDLAQAVVMDVVIPGVPPWEQVLANPYIWHFAFHSIPDLPEILVRGRQLDYFDFFFETLTAVPIDDGARREYARAYDDPRALSAGFDFYRGFRADAAGNADPKPVTTPLLYLRGDAEHGDIDAYAHGFSDNGIASVSTAIIGGSGHFAADEAPERVWELVRSTIR